MISDDPKVRFVRLTDVALTAHAKPIARRLTVGVEAATTANETHFFAFVPQELENCTVAAETHDTDVDFGHGYHEIVQVATRDGGIRNRFQEQHVLAFRLEVRLANGSSAAPAAEPTKVKRVEVVLAPRVIGAAAKRDTAAARADDTSASQEVRVAFGRSATLSCRVWPIVNAHEVLDTIKYPLAHRVEKLAFVFPSAGQLLKRLTDATVARVAAARTPDGESPTNAGATVPGRAANSALQQLRTLELLVGGLQRRSTVTALRESSEESVFLRQFGAACRRAYNFASDDGSDCAACPWWETPSDFERDVATVLHDIRNGLVKLLRRVLDLYGVIDAAADETNAAERAEAEQFARTITDTLQEPLTAGGTGSRGAAAMYNALNNVTGVVVPLVEAFPFGRLLAAAIKGIYVAVAARRELTIFADRLSANITLVLQVLTQRSVRRLICSDDATKEALVYVYLAVDDCRRITEPFARRCAVNQALGATVDLERLRDASDELDKQVALLHRLVTLRHAAAASEALERQTSFMASCRRGSIADDSDDGDDEPPAHTDRQLLRNDGDTPSPARRRCDSTTSNASARDALHDAVALLQPLGSDVDAFEAALASAAAALCAGAASRATYTAIGTVLEDMCGALHDMAAALSDAATDPASASVPAVTPSAVADVRQRVAAANAAISRLAAGSPRAGVSESAAHCLHELQLARSACASMNAPHPAKQLRHLFAASRSRASSHCRDARPATLEVVTPQHVDPNSRQSSTVSEACVPDAAPHSAQLPPRRSSLSAFSEGHSASFTHPQRTAAASAAPPLRPRFAWEMDVSQLSDVADTVAPRVLVHAGVPCRCSRALHHGEAVLRLSVTVASDAHLQRVCDAVTAVSRLRHKNVARVVGGQLPRGDSDEVVIVLEAGGASCVPLADALESRFGTAADRVVFSRQLADALCHVHEALHDGHGAVSPQSIAVRADGTPLVTFPAVLVAALADRCAVSPPAGYAAPEAFTASATHAVRAASDMYAYGVVLQRVWLGAGAMSWSSPADVPPSHPCVPTAVLPIVRRCLAAAPETRLTAAAAVSLWHAVPTQLALAPHPASWAEAARPAQPTSDAPWVVRQATAVDHCETERLYLPAPRAAPRPPRHPAGSPASGPSPVASPAGTAADPFSAATPCAAARSPTASPPPSPPSSPRTSASTPFTASPQRRRSSLGLTCNLALLSRAHSHASLDDLSPPPPPPPAESSEVSPVPPPPPLRSDFSGSYDPCDLPRSATVTSTATPGDQSLCATGDWQAAVAAIQTELAALPRGRMPPV